MYRSRQSTGGRARRKTEEVTKANSFLSLLSPSLLLKGVVLAMKGAASSIEGGAKTHKKFPGLCSCSE